MVLKFDILKLITLKVFYSLWEVREDSHRSVTLNILNTIKTFNTTNHVSRFPTGGYSDTVGIHLRKFTRIFRKFYQKSVLLLFSCIFYQNTFSR